MEVSSLTVTQATHKSTPNIYVILTNQRESIKQRCYAFGWLPSRMSEDAALRNVNCYLINDWNLTLSYFVHFLFATCNHGSCFGAITHEIHVFYLEFDHQSFLRRIWIWMSSVCVHCVWWRGSSWSRSNWAGRHFWLLPTSHTCWSGPPSSRYWSDRQRAKTETTSN